MNILSRSLYPEIPPEEQESSSQKKSGGIQHRTMCVKYTTGCDGAIQSVEPEDASRPSMSCQATQGIDALSKKSESSTGSDLFLPELDSADSANVEKIKLE